MPLPPFKKPAAWALLLGVFLAGPALRAGDAHLEQAARDLDAGDDSGALAAYSQALAQHPDDLEALLGQAQCLRRLGRLREAGARVDQALRLKADWAPAIRLKQALRAQQQIQACQALCQSADQDRALGRMEQAERGYRLALRLFPGCEAAVDGLAALGWPKDNLADVWQDGDKTSPGSAQAQGLRSLLAASRGVRVRPGQPGLPQGGAVQWDGFVRAGLQQSVRAAPAGDQDGAEALLFGRLEGKAPAWSASYSYFLDYERSATGTARVDYHSLTLQWSPMGPRWNLELDEAMEWSQGQPAYGHHLAEVRRAWSVGGPWRLWSGLQALWENYPGDPGLNAFGPSVAGGLDGPVPWGGHLAVEIRMRGDDTQDWAERDAGVGCHAVLAWRSGLDFSPRLDLDAKSQAFPDWPGGPGRWDHSLDGRLELALWQDQHCQLSAGDEVWNHASSIAAYCEKGNSVFVAGTIFW